MKRRSTSMPSGFIADAISARSSGGRASAASTSRVTGAGSRSRPTAFGSSPSAPCRSARREQYVRGAGDLERPGAGLRLNRAPSARQDRRSLPRGDGIEADRHRPPPRGHLDEVPRARPGGRLLEPHYAGFAKPGLVRYGGEGALILNRPPGTELIARPRRWWQVARNCPLQDGLRFTRLRGIDGHACRKPRAELDDATRLRQCPDEVGDKLKAVAADSGIEGAIRKAKVLHVHQLETQRKPNWRFSPGQLDHARGQVDPNDLAIRRQVTCEAIAQRPRPTGEVEDPLSGGGVDPIDDGGAAARLAAGHHLVEPLL